MDKHLFKTDALTSSRLPLWAAMIFMVVMLAGLWQMASALRHADQLEFPSAWLDFKEGRMTTGLEKQLDQHLPARQDLIAIANTLRYLLIGAGGEQVRVGSDGWLFLTEELRFDSAADTNLTSRMSLLGNASRNLAQMGVKLVIALVPDKARVYAQQLPTGVYPDYNQARYQNALLGLKREGVTVSDILTAMKPSALNTEVYYRSDTHWNQRGAKCAAQAIAETLGQLQLTLEETRFSSSDNGAMVERSGDLLRLMGLEHVPNLLRPHPDTEIPVLTQQTSADAVAGLFGDASVPVVLTGTSYSLRGNFHGFLQQALSAKVLNAAKDGGGFLQSTTNYLTDQSFKTAPPKVIVWELPERFLTLPMTTEGLWLKASGLAH